MKELLFYLFWLGDDFFERAFRNLFRLIFDFFVLLWYNSAPELLEVYCLCTHAPMPPRFLLLCPPGQVP